MSNADERSPLISEDSDSFSTSRGATSNSSGSNQIMGRGRKFLVVICILLTELCERLTYYGVTANLLLFCSNELDLDPPWPSTVSYLFIGWYIKGPPSTDRLCSCLFLLWKFALLIVVICLGEFKL